MKKILYGSVFCIWYLMSLLPLRVLYILSDGLFYLIYYVVKYRRPLVRKHLFDSFPKKNEAERIKIEKEFYSWFCDYIVETIKLFTMSKKQIKKRMQFVGAEKVRESCQKGQSCAVYLGHYCNWEWLSCVGIELPKSRKIGLIYHPLRNQAFDELFKRIRSHEENGVVVPKKEILRYLVDYKRKGIMSIFGYISDQGPKWENIHLWLPFLNHPETPVFTGGERIMRKMNDAVFYVEMSRPKRGYYTATYKLITRNPNSLPEHEITRRFFQMLEETIRKNPPYYLWTHNRWKRTREEFDKRYEVVKGKVVPRE